MDNREYTRIGVASMGLTRYMVGMDLPGDDYNVTNINYTDPHICQAACDADPKARELILPLAVVTPLLNQISFALTVCLLDICHTATYSWSVFFFATLEPHFSRPPRNVDRIF